MAPRLNRGEYWLLANASGHGLPLRLLGLPEGPPWSTTTLQEALNREGHGMDPATLADTLYRLARRRWIEFGPPPYGNHPPGKLTLDRRGVAHELATRGRFDQGPYYSLTPLGGHVWESFSRPDWDRYIEHSLKPCPDSEAIDDSEEWYRHEVMTSCRRTLDRYMDAVRSEYHIARGSESMDTRDDWTCCYWRPPRRAEIWRFVARTADRMRPPSTQWFQERWCDWR